LSALKRKKIRSKKDAREAGGNTQVGLDGIDNGGEVIALDLSDSHDSGGLLVDYSAKTGLAFDDDIGDTHLAAEGDEDEFDEVDITGGDNESSLLGLNEGNDVVKAVFHEQRLLGVLKWTLSQRLNDDEN